MAGDTTPTRGASWSIAGWPSSTCRPPGRSRWRTKTAPCRSSSTARSTITRSCARELSARGHAVPRQLGHRGAGAPLRGARRRHGLAARGMFAFAILDRRTEPGAPGPRSVRDQAALLRGARGAVDLCQRDEGDPGARAGSVPSSTGRPATTFWASATSPSRPPGSPTSPRCPRAPALLLSEAGARAPPLPRWSPQPDPSLLTRAAGGERAELLLASVKRQAVADVPVAALLSGGIDSSLVVAAHARSSDRPITTFNVGFPGPGPR